MALNKVMYNCTHFKPIITKNKVPDYCVLNGLKCEQLKNWPIWILAVHTKGQMFQVIGTLKVLTYNSIKGAMFYLPLPLEGDFKLDWYSNHLPDPELHIIINGQPTKSNNVWRSLVDVNKI